MHAYADFERRCIYIDDEDQNTISISVQRYFVDDDTSILQRRRYVDTTSTTGIRHRRYINNNNINSSTKKVRNLELCGARRAPRKSEYG